MGDRESPRSGVIALPRRPVLLLKRAEHDLLALRPEDRDLVAQRIDSLAADAAPRGALALHGRAREHVCQRVGRFRVLYRLRGETIVVVAINGGPA